MLLKASELWKVRVSLAVEKQSCFLTLVAAHPEAAVLKGQELGAPPVIRVRVYRSGGYWITSEQGGIHPFYFYLTGQSGSENPREPSKVQISYPDLTS
jgi:hypothetical protein